MADYKKMYLELFASSKKAIDELMAAQIRAEEIFLSSPDAPIKITSPDNSQYKKE